MTQVSRSAICTVSTRAQASGKRSRSPEELKKTAHRGLSRRPCCPSASSRPDEPEWQALQEMFLASRPKFVGMAYVILRNEEDAEDAVQNALLSAYLHLPAFEGRAALKTWFSRIVLNASFMIRRKRQPSRIRFFPESSTSDDTPGMESIPTSEPDPERACADEERLALMDLQLGQMRPRLRQALTMSYFEEMSTAEACDLLGVSATTFKSRLLRARRQLIKQVRRSLVPPRHRVTGVALVRGKTGFQTVAAEPAELPSRSIPFSPIRCRQNAPVSGTPNAND